MHWAVLIYWSVSALVVAGAALLTVQTLEHRRFAKGRVGAFPAAGARSRGRLALIVACKGVDSDLEDNLRPLFEQDYEDYELVFSVESAADPACGAIRTLMARYPARKAQLVVAGMATRSGQKVHNLLAATERLPTTVAVLAFVDADARPPRQWLRMLTQRLDERGAATGYRCFVPKRASLANYILASIDASVIPIMFPSPYDKVWGGSWAIRRDVFEAIGLRAAWHGTLSDDLVASRVLAGRRQRVALEPACILPSPVDVDLGGMFAFARRQFTIGRYYSSVLWCISLAWNVTAQGTFWGSLAASAWGVWTRAPWTWQVASVAGTLYALHVCRASIRRDALRFYLPGWHAELKATRRFDVWLGPVASLACCLALVLSAFGRRITWKGIAYRLRLGGSVVDISPASDRGPSAPSAAGLEAPRRKTAA